MDGMEIQKRPQTVSEFYKIGILILLLQVIMLIIGPSNDSNLFSNHKSKLMPQVLILKVILLNFLRRFESSRYTFKN